MGIKQTLLLTALLLSVGSYAASVLDTPATSTVVPKTPYCPYALNLRARDLDPHSGTESAHELRKFNDELAGRIQAAFVDGVQGKVLTRDGWEFKHPETGQTVAILSKDAVAVRGKDLPPDQFQAAQKVLNTEDAPNALEQAPFYRLDLLLARTSVYIPKAAVPVNRSGKLILNANEFHGIVIALPGIGFGVSVAKSLFEISNVLGGGRHDSLALPNGKKFRLLVCPMDAPLNGNAEHAPYGWGRPEVIREVMRNGRLILGDLFPGPKFGIMGRSQGATNAVEYSSYYDDVVGVMALNPSSPLKEILDETIEIHERMVLPENREFAMKSGFDINFHRLSWSAHCEFTSLYSFLERASKVPVGLQFSRGDWGYPQDKYAPAWEQWVERQPSARQRQWFDGPHNLWKKPQRPKTPSVQDMADYELEEKRFAEVLLDLRNFFAPLFIP